MSTHPIERNHVFAHIDRLLLQFFEIAEFRNVTLKCLTEIGSLEIQETYNEKLVVLFNIVMGHVNTMIPPSTGE